jgi:hypothetical protein
MDMRKILEATAASLYNSRGCSNNRDNVPVAASQCSTTATQEVEATATELREDDV